MEPVLSHISILTYILFEYKTLLGGVEAANSDTKITTYISIEAFN